MPLINSRRCTSCNTSYEVMEHNGELIGMGDNDNPTCPNCGAEQFVSLIELPTPIDLGDEAGYGKHYPYFDRALNMRIHSKAHRKKVMKEKGIVALDGANMDYERIARQNTENRRAKIEKLRKMDRMYEEHPAYREFRELRDKGFYNESRDTMRNRMRSRDAGK